MVRYGVEERIVGGVVLLDFPFGVENGKTDEQLIQRVLGFNLHRNEERREKRGRKREERAEGEEGWKRRERRRSVRERAKMRGMER